eukprot:GEZU01039652.1.p2 GENE.GEZU01039652.1~~GEZU01039652.1.p2  ORF type:complete len:165 (+),score=54.35 GEZU01039652.1:194-688(+)
MFKEDFPDASFKIRWLPFLLNPNMPKEGADRNTYIAQKFGSVEYYNRMSQHLIEAGKQDGIEFKWGPRIPNTLDSHRLITRSEKYGKQNQLVGVLFRMYFEEGQDIGQKQVLTKAAEEVSLTKDMDVDAFLDSDEEADFVREYDMAAKHQMNVSGVPAFIINNK